MYHGLFIHVATCLAVLHLWIAAGMSGWSDWSGWWRVPRHLRMEFYEFSISAGVPCFYTIYTASLVYPKIPQASHLKASPEPREMWNDGEWWLMVTGSSSSSSYHGARIRYRSFSTNSGGCGSRHCSGKQGIMQGNLLYQLFLQTKINGIPRCIGWDEAPI